MQWLIDRTRSSKFLTLIFRILTQTQENSAKSKHKYIIYRPETLNMSHIFLYNTSVVPTALLLQCNNSYRNPILLSSED